jgi:hypothetical protein
LLRPNITLQNVPVSWTFHIFCICLSLEKNKNIESNGEQYLLGVNDAASLAGVLALHLLRFSSSEERRLAVVSLLAARPNLLPLLQLIFPTPHLRESFRLAILHLLTAAPPASQAAKTAALFYGQILNRELFPERAVGGTEVADETTSCWPLHHSSHGPWMAECGRCVSLFHTSCSKVS